MKNILLIGIKIVFTSFIAYFLFTKIDPNQVLIVLHNLSWGGIVAAFCTLMISLVLSTYRWIYIARASIGIQLSLKDALAQVFKGFSLSQIMPSSIGGDIYRLIALKPYTKSMKEAFGIVFLDRLFGFLSMLILSLFMAPFFIEILLESIMGKLLLLAFAASVIGGILCILFNKYIHISFVRNIFQSLRNIIFSPLRLKIICLSLIFTICFVFSSYIFAKDLNLPIGLSELLLIIPLVTLATTLPISFAGWGVREGMMVTLLGLFNVPQESSLALSLSCGLLALFSALPGGIWFLMSSFKRKSGEIC